MSGPRCIVCNRPIKRKVHTYFIRQPQPATDAMPTFGLRARSAILDGHRETNSWSTTLWLTTPPQSKADAQKLVNQTVVSVGYQKGSRSAYRFTTWDGESYEQQYFCTNRCAVDQGLASAQHGHRYTWEPRP